MEQNLLVSGSVIISVTDTALHKISTQCMILLLILKTKVGFAICTQKDKMACIFGDKIHSKPCDKLVLAPFFDSRSQWPRGLRRRSMAARPLRLWVRIPWGGMDVCLL